MATPHVSGAVAVLLGSGVQPEEIPNVLKASSYDLGHKGTMQNLVMEDWILRPHFQ